MVTRIGYRPVIQGEVGQDGILRLEQETRRSFGGYSRVDTTRIGDKCRTARPEDGTHILLSKASLELLLRIGLCAQGSPRVVGACDKGMGATFTIHRISQVDE